MWTRKEIEEAGLDIFANFLIVVWEWLGLPRPTAIQLEIAYYLQYGSKRQIIEAFRGAGKTWITATFAVWNLFMNPQFKVVVVSASQTFGDQIAKFIKDLIMDMPILAHLRPRPEQRSSAIAFDVAPAQPDPTPSVSSVGITGQLAGKRADLIIGDDVEVPNNSFTELKRQKLRELVKEFDALLKPVDWAKILFLGTPQTTQTLYNVLRSRGYKMMVWPARIPEFPEKYKGTLAPIILKMIQSGMKPRQPTEPLRFTHEDLLEREASFGHTGFAMQYMLDPTPSDADRYPLKTGDLIVSTLDSKSAPIRFVWSREKDATINDLPSGGLDGDVWRRPVFESPERDEYKGTVMAIDPSGRGKVGQRDKDETSWAIVRWSHGLQYLVSAGGYTEGTSEPVLNALAATAVRFGVTHIVIEPNYGGGMFDQLLKPKLIEVAEAFQKSEEMPDAIVPRIVGQDGDEEFRWSTGQKEQRILKVLEPITQSHKLIIDEAVIIKDLQQQEKDERYSLIYQMTRLTNERESLAHDDRIEVLAMACEFWKDRMARDQKKEVERTREAEFKKQLRRIIEISRQGGTVFVDRRIGAAPADNGTFHKPSGNTHFDLQRNRSG